MGITHIIRGEDLINVTPKVLLLRAGARASPSVRCSPTCRSSSNEQRKKLSKRRDDVSVGDYIDRGYLPEAMVNYLATLGWGPPDGVEIRAAGRDRRPVPARRREHVRARSSTSRSSTTSTASTSGRSPVDEFIARSQPWLRARRARRRRGRPTLRPARCSPTWRRSCRSGSSGSPRCPATSTSCSSRAGRSTSASWQKVMVKGGRPPPRACSTPSIGAYATCDWDARRVMAVIRPRASASSCPRGRPRPRCGWP